ncbi:MAG: hypothetical protein J5I35_12175, partial [Methanothrix harundinacea]|nr:hypothetical protein [Methanothrix harundinacea]
MVAIPANKTPAHHSKTPAVQGLSAFRTLAATTTGGRGAEKIALVVVVLSIATARRRSALLEREKRSLHQKITTAISHERAKIRQT